MFLLNCRRMSIPSDQLHFLSSRFSMESYPGSACINEMPDLTGPDSFQASPAVFDPDRQSAGLVDVSISDAMSKEASGAKGTVRNDPKNSPSLSPPRSLAHPFDLNSCADWGGLSERQELIRKSQAQVRPPSGHQSAPDRPHVSRSCCQVC